ncbi:hypothetical protein ABT390_33940 [Streptomyces aurantiacus]|uniref:Uncharacterized protein n=1 Tax=Streptomyces aurantiacus JA 4570 TaxID=1286094 RepID=S4A7W3_9ACTN|nr:hypothetical protein [Streptomyces aurantiacus]EPH46880.1 hypothetical protein STRAU_0046 [Streptomyces aurantiacus JA 4570]
MTDAATLTRTTSATAQQDLIAAVVVRAAQGTLDTRHDVAVLLERIEDLQQRIDAAEAALPGITHLTPGEPAELTLYRTEHEDGPDTLPLSLYTNRAAARDHARALVDSEGIPHSATPAWVPEHSGDDAIEELILFGPGDVEDPDEDATGYLVVPVTVVAAYTPEAQE